MATIIKILSDYTPTSEPNFLKIIADGQGDFHISLYTGNDNETGVRIAASGSRHSPRVREAFSNLVKAYEEELNDNHTNPDLKKLNNKINA